MLFLAIVMLGLVSLARLPVELLPDVAYPQLVIYTEYPGAAPSDVERAVTERIEQAVASVAGVQRIESQTREGVSLVTVRFAWGTDMDFAALNVRERLDNQRGTLPINSAPVVLRTDPRSEPILSISVSGQGDLLALKELAETVFKRRLEQLDGVAHAAVTGGFEREIHVDVDPRLMASYGLTIEEIARALDAANAAGTGGTILQGRYRYSLRTLGEFRTTDEIGAVVLRLRGSAGNGVAGGSGGANFADASGAATASAPATILLRDIATITDGVRERESIARFTATGSATGATPVGGEAIGLLVFKSAGANTVEVSRLVEETLGQLRTEYPGIQLEIAADQAGFIQEAIDNVLSALVSGGLLAFLVLFLFLRNPRYPIAIATAIPISVIASFALFDALGISLNIMTLGGLALGVGMLIDNTIVVTENIFRRRQLGDPVTIGAVVGTEEVQGAITASTLTTIAVFGPIIYIEGAAGELFGALSMAVAFSLLCSILVAITVLPMMAALWAGEPIDADSAADRRQIAWWKPIKVVGSDGPHGEAEPDGGRPPDLEADTARLAFDAGDRRPGDDSRIRRIVGAPFRAIRNGFVRLATPPLATFDRAFLRFADWYHGILEASLEHRGRVVAIAVALFIAALAVASQLPRGLLPDVDQGAFRARIALERGTPLEVTRQTAERLEALIAADPGVDAVFTQIGLAGAFAGVEMRDAGLHTATLDVRLRPGASTEDVVTRIRRTLDAAPTDPEVAALGIPAGAVSIETGTSTPIGQLLGGAEADLAVRVIADDLDAALAYAATVEARLAREPSLTNVRIGTELGQPEVLVEIDREKAASYGIEPRAVADAIERAMSGTEATRFAEFDRRIPVIVRLPDSQRQDLATLDEIRVAGTPVRQMVTLRQGLGPAEIHRIDQARIVPVFADVASGGLGGAIAATEHALMDVPPPAGMRVEIGGGNEEMRRNFRDLGFAFVLSILLVYMILAAEFESLIHPLTVLLSVPLGIIGAVAALAITGSGLNTMSLIGIVILIGIADNDAVIKVDLILRLRREGMPVRQAILEAGRARLRPIVITTVTTILGILPMAIGLGTGADLRAPLAVALVGGLLIATALTLIVIPVAFDLVEEARARLRGAERSENTVQATRPGDFHHGDTALEQSVSATVDQPADSVL